MSKKTFFQERVNKALAALNLTDRAKKPKGDPDALGTAEFDNISAKYKEMFNSDFLEDLNAATAEASVSDESVQAALDIINNAMAGTGTGTTTTATETPANAAVEKPATVTESGKPDAPAAQGNLGEQLVQSTQKLVDAMTKMASNAADDKAVVVVTGAVVGFVGPADTGKYLFGIENSAFDLSKRYNKIALNPILAGATPVTTQDSKQFAEDVMAFTTSLKDRYDYLHRNNLLSEPKRLAAGDFSTNYDNIADAKVGNQFVIRRQDALIARVLMKRDVTQLFPVRYGVQDHDLIFNAFFQEVSQSWQEGDVFKGGMKIEPEMGYVDDAMIKLKFGPMKELERMYIGYLNREGSDPLKWSMIEFCVLNSLETAQVEQNKRRIRGIYVKPETGVASSYLNAGTGLIYTLLRYVHEYKLKMHDDSEYKTYTDANMLDVVQAFCNDVVMSVTEDMDLGNHVLYLNKLHQPWWIKNIRAAYGKDTDFSGPDGFLNKVPDTNISIIWLPYLAPTFCLMFLHQPGNIQMIENVPGEMLGMQMEQQMEMVRGWSVWKEGCSASFVGRKFTTKALLDANNYDWQQIFMNKPSVSLIADATTADATKGFWFETIANTAAKALTDITGAKAGVAYILECASITNGTTIAKSGKFSEITEAYTPSAVGDYIMVILNSAGKFLELERCVNGVRTINSSLQPNIPGAR